jgi:hypothetical protein
LESDCGSEPDADQQRRADRFVGELPNQRRVSAGNHDVNQPLVPRSQPVEQLWAVQQVVRQGRSRKNRNRRQYKDETTKRRHQALPRRGGASHQHGTEHPHQRRRAMGQGVRPFLIGQQRSRMNLELRRVKDFMIWHRRLLGLDDKDVDVLRELMVAGL